MSCTGSDLLRPVALLAEPAEGVAEAPCFGAANAAAAGAQPSTPSSNASRARANNMGSQHVITV